MGHCIEEEGLLYESIVLCIDLYRIGEVFYIYAADSKLTFNVVTDSPCSALLLQFEASIYNDSVIF